MVKDCNVCLSFGALDNYASLVLGDAFTSHHPESVTQSCPAKVVFLNGIKLKKYWVYGSTVESYSIFGECVQPLELFSYSVASPRAHPFSKPRLSNANSDVLLRLVCVI